LSEYSVHPETRRGDPFVAASFACVCNSGWVAIGHEVIDEETGEEAEEYALYLCKRCSEGGNNA